MRELKPCCNWGFATRYWGLGERGCCLAPPGIAPGQGCLLMPRDANKMPLQPLWLGVKLRQGLAELCAEPCAGCGVPV